MFLVQTPWIVTQIEELEPLAFASAQIRHGGRGVGGPVGAMDTPVAYHPDLEDAILPGSADVLAAILETAKY